ncbi:hypothetical protein, partial [Acidithiobacillus ferriphilus]|uniref:hypothetical protein n=1 Tax=Acidithiobacillus ferriphilus TaxID=1689834 RepID=UPI002DBE574B
SARASLPTTTHPAAGGPVGPRFVVWARAVDFVDKACTVPADCNCPENGQLKKPRWMKSGAMGQGW